MTKITRRTFIKVAGAAAATLKAAEPGVADAAAAASKPTTTTRTAARATYTFLNAQEARFIEAAVARLIPTDDVGPGATEPGFANYIDKQLAGAWGAGERLYRSGPWQPGAPTQGYQLPYTPAELFRNALRGIHDDLMQSHRQSFADLSVQEQDAYLTQMQKSTADYHGVPANVFFESLLSMTIEGFFCDPVYGGNHDMVAWKMIGFPGAYATYYDLVDRHGMAFTRAPMSLAEDGRGHVHVQPNISSYPSRDKGK